MAEAVDSDQPFVYSQGLEVRVFEAYGDSLLQASRYGDTSTDYRIDSHGELYITNFKTAKEPAEYAVEVWQLSTDFKLGSFSFETAR